MNKLRPVILDGDPGHDDAIAWMLAKASPMLDIRAVTSVCGNQTIEKRPVTRSASARFWASGRPWRWASPRRCWQGR